jgi:M6 family metalloprotease-like protein
VAVVLALFSDSPEPHVSASEVQRVLFDGPTPYGTVTEYYREVSGGRFEVTGRVAPWVRTGLTMAEVVGSDYGLGEDARTGEYLLQALTAADAVIDFRQFDNDGPDGIPDSGDDDGVADAVAVQFLEVGASCGGPAIWPHRARVEYWFDAPFESNDVGAGGEPILVNDYTTQGATDCGGVEVQTAATIAHELGHVLGLPDLYDSSRGLEAAYRRWVVGCWSLMAAGSWGCGASDRLTWRRPTHFSPWEKELLGWLDAVEVVSPALGQSLVLEPVETSRRVLKIPLETQDEGEYLLMEYRKQEGFDVDLPASGVMLYHVDPKIPGNRPCDTCPQVYRVGVLEADGNDGLRLAFADGGNRGEAGDAWGVSVPGEVTNRTYPSTRLNSGEASQVTIYRIALADGKAHITLSTRAIPIETLLQSFLGTGVPALSPLERAYLDGHGNGNGQFDVGDLRAYLRR